MAVSEFRASDTRLKTIEALTVLDSLIMFDVETTGLNCQTNHIIQISGLRVDTKTFEEIERINVFINPGYSIPKKITELTGITTEFIKTKPLEVDVFDEIYNFFGENPSVGAYNTPFDLRFLKELYKRNNKPLHIEYDLDVLKMAKDIVKKGETKGNKLCVISEYYGVNAGLTFHDAIDDVIATTRLLKIFYDKYLEIEAELSINPKMGQVAKINEVYHWEGLNHYQARISVKTDLGEIYYSTFYKKWLEKTDEAGCMKYIDMDKLIIDVYEFIGISSEEEFVKFKGSKTYKEVLGKEIAEIERVWYFEGYNVYTESIYIKTNFGLVYFNVYDKKWKEHKDSKGAIEKIDMNKLKESIINHLSLTDEKDLVKWKGDKKVV